MGGIPAGRSSVLLESFKVLLSRLFIHRIDMAFFSIINLDSSPLYLPFVLLTVMKYFHFFLMVRMVSRRP